MDAFFASVEQADNPDLAGKPVIVGGRSMRGVVSASSYEARKYGVRSAMPIFKAKKLCPHGIFVPVRGSRYKEISDQVMDILRRYSSLVEPASIDEAYVDVTGVERLFGRAEQIAAQAENGLSSGQEAEIKDIQKQIGDITKMPMNENLVEKAKDQAEAKKAEAQANADQDDPSRNGQDGNMPGDQNRLDMAEQPGNQMLRQNAFITTVKTAGASLGASSGFKGKA